MSVSHLSLSEFGVMAGIAVKLKLQTLSEACTMCELLSRSNSAAYTVQYDDPAESWSADEIEREALSALTTPSGLLGHFGPCVYNCITNGGKLYVGEIPASVAQSESIADEWRAIEDACRKWQNSERSRIERQAEDDAAFVDVGPLPKIDAELLSTLSRSHKFDRIIYAECRVDESESQSDYWGSRMTRRVVIGFGAGKRESFKQLREAAATFEPTRDYGPNCDEFTVYVECQNDFQWNGYYRKGDRSNWHSQEGHGTKFATEAAAMDFIEAQPKLVDCHFADTLVSFAWTIHRESVEHRENYSMGGGNYIGQSRHGGWVVKSCRHADCIGMEYHEPPAIQPKSRKAALPRVRREENVEQPALGRVTEPTTGEVYAANV